MHGHTISTSNILVESLDAVLRGQPAVTVRENGTPVPELGERLAALGIPYVCTRDEHPGTYTVDLNHLPYERDARLVPSVPVGIQRPRDHKVQYTPVTVLYDQQPDLLLRLLDALGVPYEAVPVKGTAEELELMARAAGRHVVNLTTAAKEVQDYFTEPR